MRILKKEPQKDFLVLNITDLHISREYLAPDNMYYQIMTYTVTELVRQLHPDLITASGDFTWAGQFDSCQVIFSFLDSFGIPWAPVWGNHDNQGGTETVEQTQALFRSCKNCLYEAGDPALGHGNYVIRIEENGKPVEGLLMMDTHDCEKRKNADGTERTVWGHLLPAQLDWYKEQITALAADGCHDTSVILHIPIYAYREASEAAFRKDIDKLKITPEESMGSSCWNQGYETACGVQYENISAPEEDEGMMDLAVSLGSTRHILCGHNHINSTMIPYRGIILAFGLKTGQRTYANPILNGGTLLRINRDGVDSVVHVPVDISRFLKNKTAD